MRKALPPFVTIQTRRRETQSDSAVLDDQQNQLVCTRCGAVQSYQLPMLVDSFVRLIETFERAHRECAPTDRPNDR